MGRSDGWAPNRRMWWGAGVATVVVALAACWIAAAPRPSDAQDQAVGDVRGAPLGERSPASVGPGPSATGSASTHDAPTTDARGVTTVTLQTLADFRYPPRHKSAADPVPKEIRALSGRRVSIKGYMLPIDYGDDECTQFILSGCPPGCCFGCSVLPNGFIGVTVAKGKKASCSGGSRFVDIEGVLDVHGLEKEDEGATPLYTMTADVVKATP